MTDDRTPVRLLTVGSTLLGAVFLLAGIAKVTTAAGVALGMAEVVAGLVVTIWPRNRAISVAVTLAASAIVASGVHRALTSERDQPCGCLGKIPMTVADQLLLAGVVGTAAGIYLLGWLRERSLP